MAFTRPRLVLLALCTAAFPVTAAVAQNHVHEGDAAAAQPEMPPEMAAMMAAWEAAAKVGPEHERLATMAGSWNVRATMWMPGAPEAMSSAGTAERTMALGGRVLYEHYRGEMMGQPFEGMAHSGYDNVNKRWWSTWTDNMSTTVMLMHGKSEGPNTEIYSGSMTDPVSGASIGMRIVAVIESPDREVHTFYETHGDAPEVKGMELVYERKK